MSSKLNQPLIPIEPIQRLVQTELGLLIFGLAIGAYVVYRLFLRNLSQERHDLLTRLFRNLAIHLTLGAIFFGAYLSLIHLAELSVSQTRALAYLGLLTLIQGATVTVKVARIYVFEYLFISHMRVGVPLLLINLSTLTLSVILVALLVTEIFSIRLGPLVATSAVFSLVLGLALQETLGNLFSGVALQMDKPYEIGDWIELTVNSQKLVGQVREITWRATVLAGIGDEIIIVPNRLVGSAQISNYASKTVPIARSQSFRLPYNVPVERAKSVLSRATANVPGIASNPAPLVLVTEASEYWVVYKVVYFITDLGAQLTIADRVLTQALIQLENEGIPLPSTRIQMVTADEREIALT